MGSAENKDCRKDKYRGKYNGITVDGRSHIHQDAGKACHLRAKLYKYLIKDGHNLYQKNDDNRHHHACHKQRIGNGALYALSDGGFPLIMRFKRCHNFIKSAGLLSDLYHVDHIGRKQICIIKRQIQVSCLLHILDQSL